MLKIKDINGRLANLREKSISQEREPVIILRRAEILKEIFRYYPVRLDPDELIVGTIGYYPIPEHLSWIREYWNWQEREWQNQLFGEKYSREADRLIEAGGWSAHGCNGLHIVVDYELAIKKGFKKIIEDIRRKLQETKERKKKEFYQAVILSCEGLIEFAGRYASEARELAEKESNPERKRELEEIARISEKVPQEPAETFHEALQSFWFTHIGLQLEDGGGGMSPGRFDQYMFPFYKKDLEEGRLTKEEALMLLEFLWLKFMEIGNRFPGFVQSMMLGGRDKKGKDATNELSYLCLEATKRLKVYGPAVYVRMNEDTPQEFWEKAVEVYQLGLGLPQFFNDRVCIEGLVKAGVRLEDARDYSAAGCMELTLSGTAGARPIACYYNVAKSLELALNGGKDFSPDKKIGISSKDISEMDSFQEVMEAFKKEFSYDLKVAVENENLYDKIRAEFFPLPLYSSVVSDCLEEGKDMTWGGGRYKFTGIGAIGIPDVADSLAAVKKLVFEERKVDKKELLSALRSDFNGREILRQLLLNRAPKFGNDDNYVDSIAKEITQFFCEELKKYENPKGGKFLPMIFSFRLNVLLGAKTGALPSGRKKGEPLAQSFSSHQGEDRKGPTALIRSIAKIDHTEIALGVSSICDLTPSIGAEETKERGKRMELLIKTAFDLGLCLFHGSFVDKKILIEAQKNPQRYRNLTVRVTGYSAYFTVLDKALQDHIIARIGHKI